MKSERLKKLETELFDLEQWEKLGLVPKKDSQKHKEEINLIREKIAEEKERLRFLKESGEVEEYIIPKKNTARPSYADNPTIPDMDMQDDDLDNMEVTMETVTMTAESTTTSEMRDEEGGDEYTRGDEEDPFSDKNRWKRGVLDVENNDSEQW